MADNLTPKEEFLLNPVTEHNITDAAVASFETNFKHPLKVTMPITPIQDLHGMPNPYPAGVSVNLIPDGTDTSNGYVDSYYLMPDNTTTANANLYISEFFKVDPTVTYTWSNAYNPMNPAICFYDENKNFISGIASAQQMPITFTPPEGTVYARSSQTKYSYQVLNSTLNNCYQLEVGSTATEYRRYSNICSIEGWTKCECNCANENLFDIKKIYSSFYVDDNTIEIVGGAAWRDIYTNSAGLTAKVSQQYINNLPYLKAGSYKISCTLPQGYFRIFMVIPADGSVSRIAESNTSGDSKAVNITLLEDSYITIRVSSNPATISNLFLRLMTSNANYSVHKSSTISITFTDSSSGDPMTVYGGTLTLNEDGSADVVSDKAYAILNDPDLWAESTGTQDFAYQYNFSDRKLYSSSYQGLICSAFPVDATQPAYMRWTGASSYKVGIKNNTTAYTLSEIKAFAEAGKIAICYDLATPQTYHFSNLEQLKAFLGQNNVWSNIANVDVKYLTQNSETGLEYRGDRALELRRRAMIADAPKIHTTVGSSATGGLASFKSYVKAPVKKIEIPFSPKQDFNGYDFPWPGGGYVQLFNSATTTYGYKLDVDGTPTEDANYFISDFIPVTASTYYYVSGEMPVVVGYDSSQEFLQVIKNSETGGAFQTPENCAYIRIQNYTEESDASAQASAAGTAYMCAGSEENQWYPYENICPIEGYDRCEITRTGKNLMECISANKIGTGVSVSDGVLTAATNNKTEAGIVFPVKPNTQYALSFTKRSGSNIYVRIAEYTRKPTSYTSYRIREIVHDNSATSGVSTVRRGITTSNNAKYVFLGFYRAYNTATVKADDWVANRFENGYSYEEYKGNTIPLTFNQTGDHAFAPIQEGTGTPSSENVRPIHLGLTFTRDDDSALNVYGGTLTVNADGTGSLEDNRVFITLDGTEAWTFNLDNCYVCTAYKTPSYRPGICNISGFSTSYAGVNGAQDMRIAINQNYIITNIGTKLGYPKSNEGAAQFREWLTTHPIQLCYVLETPITYALSVTETNRALEALGLTQHIGPLYGGTVTINPDGSADVVSDKAYAILNDPDLWAESTGTQDFAYQYNFSDREQYSSSYQGLICSTFPVDAAQSAYMRWTGVSSYKIGIKNNTTTYTLPEIKEFAEADKIAICYDLATPQTYHFSNLEQLKVWLGENNFWCDISDDITVKYLNRG